MRNTSESQGNYNFVPPTSPEPTDEFGHLRADIEPGDVIYQMNPFALFEQIGPELAAENEVSPDDLVIAIQHLSGQALDGKGLRIMHGWASEEVIRQGLIKSGKWTEMSQTDQVKAIWGIVVDYGEDTPAEKRTVV